MSKKQELDNTNDLLLQDDDRYLQAWLDGEKCEPIVLDEVGRRLLRRLIIHDRAADDREGYEGCIEIQYLAVVA